MKKIFTYCLLFCGLITYSVASADIVYLNDNRYINHTMDSGPIYPTSDYADFNEEWWAFEAGASQTSSVNNTGMSGTGSTYAGYDAMFYGAQGTSLFDVTFTVDQLTDFTLNGSLDTSWWDSTLSVSLLEDGEEIFGLDNWTLPSDGLNLFATSGQMSSDSTYQLILLSSSLDSEYYNETWQFELTTVSAVPVPAAVWLFMSGLAGLLIAARRK